MMNEFGDDQMQDLQEIEKSLVNFYDIYEVQEGLKGFLDIIIIEELNFEDKYKLYQKMIELYKNFYKEVFDTTNYNECDLEYCEIINDIVKNIKMIFKRLQMVQLESVCIELMKPERVLSRLTTYEDYEFN
jgi:hypothetical protein